MKILFHAMFFAFNMSLFTAWGKVSERMDLDLHNRQFNFLVESALGKNPAYFLEADPQMAYLIIEATVSDKELNQPNRIYLSRGSSSPIEISANSSIVAVYPGRYRISGIYFHADKYYGVGSLTITEENIFDVGAGKIYLIGNLVLYKTFALTENSDPMYTINLVNDIQILQRACERSPQVFEAFPINTFGKSSEFKLDCNK